MGREVNFEEMQDISGAMRSKLRTETIPSVYSYTVNSYTVEIYEEL